MVDSSISDGGDRSTSVCGRPPAGQRLGWTGGGGKTGHDNHLARSLAEYAGIGDRIASFKAGIGRASTGCDADNAWLITLGIDRQRKLQAQRTGFTRRSDQSAL